MNHWPEKPHVLYIIHLVSYFSCLTLDNVKVISCKKERKTFFLLIMSGGIWGRVGVVLQPPNLKLKKCRFSSHSDIQRCK